MEDGRERGEGGREGVKEDCCTLGNVYLARTL